MANLDAVDNVLDNHDELQRIFKKYERRNKRVHKTTNKRKPR